MIKKIKSIGSFGVFSNFTWDNHVKKTNNDQPIQDLSRTNIIYGRNYSGKTTLSRIIRALETGYISSNYKTPAFSILWEDGSESSVAKLQEHSKTIRVFNEDFIRENLEFLVDTTNPQGQIKAFAIIGAGNIKIEGKIKQIKDELGNSKKGKESGLYAKLQEYKIKQEKASTLFVKIYDDLKKKKIDKARGDPNGIKYRLEMFGEPNYDITRLENDIKEVSLPSYVSINDKTRQELERSISEIEKPTISPLSPVTFDFQKLSDEVKSLVEKEIGVSEKIQDLLRDYALNEWVKTGYKIHKDKQKKCAFCGCEIQTERWDALNKHFDEETATLEQDIEQLISKINNTKRAIELSFSSISKDKFYAKFHKELDEIISEYKSTASQNYEQLELLIQQLEKRKREITVRFDFILPKNYEEKIKAVCDKYEIILKESNEHTNVLSKTKKENQKIRRLHEVRTFLEDIDYTSEMKKIVSSEADKLGAEAATQAIQSVIDKNLQDIEILKGQQNDEERGKQKINGYLNHFFGHQFLSFKTVTEENTKEKKIHFEIFRGDQRAFDLSEGERSLIAFCYFMGKLDDVVTADKKPIIWIDDPISSLDGNHIFFVYSLLRAEIVEKQRFEQLFVSTHNLDFLKYLKRLPGGKNNTWLVVERTGENAIIKNMPHYLKEYITEFNYLFHQLYKCANATSTDDSNYTVFYGFGNNLRKFLEIYLYYKFPDGLPEAQNHIKKMSDLLGDRVTAFLTDRFNNESSHLSGAFERGQILVDVPEMQLVARTVLEKLKAADKLQYESFLISIKEQDMIPDANIAESNNNEQDTSEKKQPQKRKKNTEQSMPEGLLFPFEEEATT